jgi:two-component system alkaline phosphatase synthesis response regulator PhoP
MKVLVAENHHQTLTYLCDLLEKDGFKTVSADNGADALKHYKTGQFDFICLDIMMPDINGYDVCREIRKTDTVTPIIFISSKTETVDKVLGLEMGADDYIVKPFDIHEVVARMRAVARRCLSRQSPEKACKDFLISDLKIFPNVLKAERNGAAIDLSLREIKILQLMYNKRNQIVDRNDLLDYCWGAHIMPESRTVDWHISQLRKRIEIDPKDPKIILTVHGVGYKYIES